MALTRPTVADPVPFGADPARSVRATITQATLERAFAILMAVAAAGFGAATLPSVLDQLPRLDPVWGPVAAAAVYATILFVAASAFLPRLARPAQLTLTALFLVVLVTWPATVPGGLAPGHVPWPWWLCNVATIAAAMSLSTWMGAVANLIVPLAYGLIRLTPSGGSASVPRAALDAVYIMILGGAALALIAVLRRAAADVDRAQAMAVSRYATAIRDHATEVERVQVDAIVHDSVLTTFLSAARADTPEAKALAGRMARNAIDHLARASAEAPTAATDATVPVAELRERIVAGVADLAVTIRVGAAPKTDRSMPEAVAEAITAAAVQAAVNSVQHAGDVRVRRWIGITASPDGGIGVEVGDAGRGFDIHAVPAERLGVRRSILERVASAGGEARVLSTPGIGTRVLLTWTEPAS
jgi:signal transduction histidine kinase